MRITSTSRAAATPEAARAVLSGATRGAPTPPADAPATPTPAVVATSPREKLKALSQAHRAHLDRVKLAQADVAAAATPERVAAFAAQSAELLDWTRQQAKLPENAEYQDFFESWLLTDAGLYLAARPLATALEQTARYAGFADAYAKTHDMGDKALMAAAVMQMNEGRPRFPVGPATQAAKDALAPAIHHLATSDNPDARKLAEGLSSGAIKLKLTNGQQFGTQYYAVVAVSAVSVSNGEKGPDFFDLSPPFQAAVLLHEYTHIGQKATVSGMLAAMLCNLGQRFYQLLGMLPGVDEEAMANRGRRFNRAEQEAYRVEKQFLADQGFTEKGLTSADYGMMVGVETWLEAAS